MDLLKLNHSLRDAQHPVGFEPMTQDAQQLCYNRDPIVDQSLCKRQKYSNRVSCFYDMKSSEDAIYFLV